MMPDLNAEDRGVIALIAFHAILASPTGVSLENVGKLAFQAADAFIKEAQPPKLDFNDVPVPPPAVPA